MLVVHDDIIYDLQNGGGISVYWTNLKKGLLEKYDILSFNGKTTIRDRKLPTLFQRYLDFNDKINEKHIFHSSYYRISRNPKAINIVTVHDFIYEYYRSGARKYLHTCQKRRALEKAHGIICVSLNTKNDLMKLYPQIDEKKISVIYHGVSDAFHCIQTKLSSNSRSLLFVGNRSGYKNFNLLVEFLKLNPDYSLNIVGGGQLTKKEKNALLQINYKHHQRISDQELNKLYNQSYALVYPSLYEGFGLPILEALRAGCPVICNDGSSTSEIEK